ncbi:MAG: DUF5103 domain-containing protein [Bacteroidales bacterium]
MKLIYCSLAILMCGLGTPAAVAINGPLIAESGLSGDYEGITFTDNVYDERIKTVEFYRSGWHLSAPVRNLRDTTRLILEFDGLEDNPDVYSYTLIHCSSGWEPSDIPVTQYLTGIPESEIRDYRYSRNTLQPYIHYTLEIPNADLVPKLPGNYILFIFRNYDRERPVLTRRFFIVDPRVTVQATAHRTDNLDRFNTAQEVDFTIFYENLPLDDPMRNISVTLCQNLNFLTAITDLKPNYIQPDRLIYEYDDINLFPGGSEFRYFDTKNLKYLSERIREIRFIRPLRHVFLHPDQDRSGNRYDYYEELNGRFFIRWDEASDDRTEADYLQVHFTLALPEPLESGELFLFGGLTGFGLRPEARMNWEEDERAYRATLLLKQGYYNYQYAFLPEGASVPVYNAVDGSHYETENDYYIFVYYRDIRERFDRLVALQVVNSVRPATAY